MIIYGILQIQEPDTYDEVEFFDSFYLSKNKAIDTARALAKRDYDSDHHIDKTLTETWKDGIITILVANTDECGNVFEMEYNVVTVDVIE